MTLPKKTKTSNVRFNTGVLLVFAAGIGGCGDSGSDQVSSATSEYQVVDSSEKDSAAEETSSHQTADHSGRSDEAPRAGRFESVPSTERVDDPTSQAATNHDAPAPRDERTNAGRSGGRQREPIDSPPSAGSRSGTDSSLNVDELLDQIAQIERQIESGAIPGSTREQQDASFRRMISIRLQAAEQILAQDVEPHQQMMAKLAKLDSLSIISRATGAQSAISEYAAFAEELSSDEDEEVRLAGTSAQLQALRSLAGSGDEQDRQQFDKYAAQCEADENADIRAAAISARINLLMQLTDAGDTQASAELEEYLDEMIESDNEQVRFTAINSKLAIMDQMIDAELPGARDQVEQFARSLTDDANADVAEMARLTLFSLKMRDVNSGNESDPSVVVDALRPLLENSPKTPTLFESTRVAINVLQQGGHQAASREAIQLIVDAFKDNENEPLAAAAKSLSLQAELQNFNMLVNNLLRGEGDGDPESIITSANEMLSVDPNASKLRFIGKAAEVLEFSGETAVAKSLYNQLDSTYSNHEDLKLRDHAQQLVEKGLGRVNLVGQPLELTGELSTGETFDWSSYRGKVVLVDFWATWCTPCRDELPNIVENYEQFQADGFEVVGVNIDEDRDKAKRFIEAEKIPWANIVADESGSNANAERYQVEAIPFVILVGRDGNVAVLHVRGPNLAPEIEKLLAQPNGAPATGSLFQPDEVRIGRAAESRDAAQ